MLEDRLKEMMVKKKVQEKKHWNSRKMCLSLNNQNNNKFKL